MDEATARDLFQAVVDRTANLLAIPSADDLAAQATLANDTLSSAVAARDAAAASSNTALGAKADALASASAAALSVQQANAAPAVANSNASMPITTFTSGPTKTIPLGINHITTTGYSTQGVGGAPYVNDDATVTAAYVAANPRTSFITANGRGFRLQEGLLLTPYMFGATGGFKTEAEAHAGPDDYAPLQAMFTFWGTRTNYDINLMQLYWGSSAQILIQRLRNGADQHSSGVIHVGNICATNGSTGTDLVVINWPYGKIQGRMGAFGTGGTSYASRGWINGIKIVDSAGLHAPDGFETWQFKRWGAYTDTLKIDGTAGGNNIALNIGKVHGGSCGSVANPSAAASTKLTYTFDSVVYNGAAGDPAQTMTVHVTTPLDPNLKPQDPFIYDEPSGARSVYTVSAIDFAANTLTFNYWFPGAVTAGTLTSAHGGLMMIEGSNTAYTVIGQVTGMYLGCGLDDRGMYGAQVQYVGVEVTGIEYARGSNPTSVSYGGMLLQRHAESTYIDLFIKSTSNKRGLFIGPADVSGSGLAGANRDLLGQTYQSSPRNADDTLAYRLDGVVFNDEFGLITPDADFANVFAGSTSFTVSNRPHERYWRKAYNSAAAVTVTLDWYDDYSRLWTGKNWMGFELFGTSSRGGVDSVTVQLTAALIAAGWTLNGGTAALNFPKLRGPAIGRCVVDVPRKAFKFVLQNVEPAALFGTTVNGDVSVTLTVGASTKIQIWNTPLTTNRGVTLSAVGVSDGDTFEIIRTAAATGAFNLNVGTGPLKALAAGQKAKVTYSSALAAWVLTGFESL